MGEATPSQHCGHRSRYQKSRPHGGEPSSEEGQCQPRQQHRFDGGRPQVGREDGAAQLSIGSPDDHRVVVQWRDPDGHGWTAPTTVWTEEKLVLIDEKGGGAVVEIADVYQSNGVAHVVDTVLMPK